MTTKITKFDRRNVGEVNEAIRKAMREVAERFGLEYTPERFKFSDTATHTKVALTVPKDNQRADFEKHCGRFGLKPEHFGAKFQCEGREFTITGLKPRNRKYPILVEGARGGRYKMMVSQVVPNLPDADGGANHDFKVGDRVTYTNPFNGTETGTVEGFLGDGRVRLLLTTGETRTPKRSDVTPLTGKRDEDDILDDIDRVYGNLSPENLTCDGECSRSEVQRRSTAYNRALRALFKELGREVTESECYDRFRKANAS